jgi:putative IMPACT (imprinted ancient) family translation regulator
MNVLPAPDPLQSMKQLTVLIETYHEQHATRGHVSFATVNFTTNTTIVGISDLQETRGSFNVVCVEDMPNIYYVLAILTSVVQIIPYWSAITLSVLAYSDHNEFQQNAQQVMGHLAHTDETKNGH